MSWPVASIPSPSSNQLEIGPLQLNYYGLCIGLGVVAAVLIGQRRWAARGGNPADISYVATWAVPAGLVGARAYHLITDWRPIEDWLKVWEGGLGIPGGLGLGILVGYWAAKRKGLDIGNAIDAVIPGIPVAQAIGRVGNWFNQEIFGRPTDVPWAVEIDERFRPAAFTDEPTFHPAFLYEALWNLGLAGFLIWIDRRGVLKKGMLLPLYVLGYGIGRFVVEGVRIDAATLIFGIRVNHWVSGGAVLISAVALILLFRRGEPSFFAATGPDQDDAGSDASDLVDDLDPG
ncbi:MAG: prolipoprotein diacylglyceryl transferase [Acidimicrobiia bacterium]|nr:prolipoprotein diacylglyceryl transferase [Acidimicrobiia bacterium]